jgi:hypothetical protein
MINCATVAVNGRSTRAGTMATYKDFSNPTAEDFSISRFTWIAC